MRFLAAILLITVISVPALATDLTDQDKSKHVGACATISAATYSSLRAAKFGKVTSSVMSFSLAMLVGHIKETTDKRYDAEDIHADAVGAGIGLMIPLSFTF